MSWIDEQGAYRGHWFGRLHLSWPMLLLAGWLLYEFTAQPGLAALVACAKFGWADVRTAFWLRRVDPDRPRGYTCFWCYLTYGLWKVAVMATLTMIVLGFVSVLVDRLPRQPQPNNGLSPVVGGALAAAAIGFGLSFPTTYIAIASALRNGIRIWLGPAPSRARKERFWPPRHGNVNAAPFVGFTILIMTEWFILFLAIAASAFWQPAGVLGLTLFLGTIAAIVVVLVLFCCIFRRILARAPAECWMVEEGEMVYQVPHAEEFPSDA